MDSLDYQNLVFDDYKYQVLTNKELSYNLLYPTTTKLKKECLRVYQDRYNRKDERTLDAFFGPYKDKDECLEIMKNCKPDKFKAFWKCVKGKTPDPDINLIELLAWLIDFQPRPLDIARAYNANEIRIARMGNPAISEVDKVESGDNVDMPEVGFEKVENENQKENDVEEREQYETEGHFPYAAEGVKVDDKRQKSDSNIDAQTSKVSEGLSKIPTKKSAIIISFIVVLLLGGSGIILKRMRDGKEIDKLKPITMAATTGPKRYMYWTGEEYREMFDSIKIKGAMVIPFDSAKLVNFKKITDPTTINQSDIKHVWYVKFSIDDSIEYYTGEGNHPVDTSRRLIKMSPYMYKTRILPLKKLKEAKM